MYEVIFKYGLQTVPKIKKYVMGNPCKGKYKGTPGKHC